MKRDESLRWCARGSRESCRQNADNQLEIGGALSGCGNNRASDHLGMLLMRVLRGCHHEYHKTTASGHGRGGAVDRRYVWILIIATTCDIAESGSEGRCSLGVHWSPGQAKVGRV